jgi:hypothetical protein
MPLKHINTNKFPANYLVGFRDLVFSWLNEFLNPIMHKTASIIYNKNKKAYTYFRYKILFPPVINSDLENQALEYQSTNFLHPALLPCCFTVIPSVIILLFSVISQI